MEARCGYLWPGIDIIARLSNTIIEWCPVNVRKVNSSRGRGKEIRWSENEITQRQTKVTGNRWREEKAIGVDVWKTEKNRKEAKYKKQEGNGIMKQ